MIDLRSLHDASAGSAERISALVRDGRDVWVPVEPEAGRHDLVRALEQAMPEGLVEIELLSPRELDGVTHLLVQLARAVGAEPGPLPRSESDADSHAAIRERAQDLGQRLPRDGALVVLLPLDWPRVPSSGTPVGAATDQGARVRLGRIEAALAGLAAARRHIIVVSRTGAWHPWRSAVRTETLRRREITGHDIRVDDAAGVEAAASEVRELLLEEGRAVSPIEARALVGLAALDLPVDDLLTSSRLHDGLFARLAQGLLARTDLAADLRCLTLARQPLRVDKLDALLTATAAPILRHCVLYGDEHVRMPAPVARALTWELPRDRAADESCHRRLATYHRSLDGVASPVALSQATAIQWLEKVHHLAGGGAQSAEEWGLQSLLDRDQHWERARYLSKVARRFSEAAAVYQECLDRFGGDSYTHHYLGYNLDRAGAPLAEVRTHYQTALALEQDNPWWNTRWVTFLIGHGTLREAKTAWEEALSVLDPDGDRIETSPWLALHLHRWVVRRWLALGYVGEAREVLDSIPRPWLQQEQDLALVERMVADAEESVELGEAVYPPGTPIAERWSPAVTPEQNGLGSQRIRWWPGRVVAASAAEVVMVLADPRTHTAFRVVYTAAEWRAFADQPAQQASGYVEVAEYEDGSRRVRLVYPARGEALHEDQRDVFARLGWSAT